MRFEPFWAARCNLDFILLMRAKRAEHCDDPDVDAAAGNYALKIAEFCRLSDDGI